MGASDIGILAGQIVEQELALTLDELCSACAVERERLMDLLEYGLLEGPGEGGRFGGDALRRVRLAVRLQRDLGVNAAGAALAVELLARIDALEARLRGG